MYAPFSQLLIFFKIIRSMQHIDGASHTHTTLKPSHGENQDFTLASTNFNWYSMARSTPRRVVDGSMLLIGNLELVSQLSSQRPLLEHELVFLKNKKFLCSHKWVDSESCF